MDDEEGIYHEPIWLKGLRDPAGVLKSAVETNRVVDNLEINIDDDFLEVDLNDAHAFMTSISQLNGLRSIRLLPERFNKIYSLPVDLLTIVLRETPDLQMFSICAVDLAGSEEDFAQFLTTVGSHRQLSLFRLIRCRLPETTNLLDQLIVSLSEIQNLRELELSAAEESALGTLSAESFELLYRQPSLEKFRLDNFELEEQRMLGLFEALEHNNRLKGVHVSSCALGQRGLQAMARMLRTNNALEELSVCLTSNRDQSHTDESFISIAQSLQENSSLREFRLSGSNRWPKLIAQVQQSFLQMLHRNFTLERLSLFETTTLQREIDFLLALNRMGRKRVMEENATKQDWLTVIVNSQVDLNCLYFFLSTKPELLDGAI